MSTSENSVVFKSLSVLLVAAWCRRSILLLLLLSYGPAADCHHFACLCQSSVMLTNVILLFASTCVNLQTFVEVIVVCLHMLYYLIYVFGVCITLRK